MIQAALVVLLDLGLVGFLTFKDEIFFAQIVLLTQLGTFLALLPFILRGEVRLRLPSSTFANMLVLGALAALFSPFFFVSQKYWTVNTKWGEEARTFLFGYGDLLLVLSGVFATVCLLAAAIRRGEETHD